MRKLKIHKPDIQRWKEPLRKILFPHGFLVFLLFNLTIVLLVYSLAYSEAIPAVQYASYAISSYALVVVCARIPGIIKRIKNILYGNELTAKYLTEKQVRDTVSLHTGIAMDCLMAVLKIIMGIWYRSYWLLAVAIYHVTLGFMHFMLLKKEWSRGGNESEEFDQEKLKRLYQLRSYRFCGNLMFFLNVAMTGMLIQMIWQGQGYTYPGFTVYAFAAYAFYCLISAMIKWIKYRKIEDPTFTASKNIKLAKALMSLFTLQTVLINQFGAEMAEITKMIMNSMTGILICASVFALAVIMVIKGNEEIRKLKQGV